MKTSYLAVTLTAIGLASLTNPAVAQIYAGGGQPAIEVNLDVLDSLPQTYTTTHGKHVKTRAKIVRHPVARTTFRNNSGQMISYTGGDTGPLSYEQAVHRAGGTINNGGTIADEDEGIEAMPLSSPSSPVYRRSGVHPGKRSSRQSSARLEEAGYDTVDNLNRLSVECSAGNMVQRGQAARVIQVSDEVPMAPPLTSAGLSSIPVPLNVPPHTVPAANGMGIRPSPRTVDLPDTPAVVSAPLPPSPSIETTPIPADVPMVPAAPPPAPYMPLPMAPTPVAMTAPPVPSRLMPDDLKIDFAPNSEKLPGDASMHLNRLAAKLTGSPELRVELRSFATGSADMASKARRLALARALSVRSYLTSQGVDSERIDVRALGNAANAAPGDRVDIFLTR